MVAPKSLVTFDDGDVLIKLSATISMQLHSSTLRRSSALFNDMLAEEYSAILSPQAKNRGVRIRYRLELTERPAAGEIGSGVLTRLVR